MHKQLTVCKQITDVKLIVSFTWQYLKAFNCMGTNKSELEYLCLIGILEII